ncbi:DUF6777 domain-containing protein [Streptomyces telluris]|uniref:DUF6777 domain-containing protein n=1 Tax=Streptomyces telluris TaxID=2720021 RepID=A0A9X2RL16_9ACTN|nr:DUF6777 domain-containing protein [Streptomyces telluris]MCQ8770412.1 hypothetical protein [Streptomyces telluris]NJP76708.1 hypothetical protein [Streptomyces telluris]
MSSEPPSEDRPTGPPSGPLSGGGSGSGRTGPPTPAEPPEPTRADWPSSGGGRSVPSAPEPPGPPGPPAPPTGGHAAPPPGGEPPRPWWRSGPKVALVGGLAVVVAALAVYFLRPEGGGEVFLQAASAEGRDPFTPSTAKEKGTKEATAAPVSPAPGGTRTIEGSSPGLYGGSENESSCDVERQIKYLTENQNKARAFASAAGIQQGEIPGYLRGLTPVQLRSDTRVTNHGYKNGSATPYQAVLQAGTAVLADNRGVPRVRCACGNPLSGPVAIKGSQTTKGQSWSTYKSSQTVAVAPARTVIVVIIIYDPRTGEWFERPVGTDGSKDRRIPPPKGGVTSGPATPPSEEPSSTEPSKPYSSPPASPPSAPPPPPTEPGPAYGPQNRKAGSGGAP